MLDLFLLHDSTDNRAKKLIVFKGEKLPSVVMRATGKLRETMSRQQLIATISENVHISKVTASRLIGAKREWYPIPFLSLLVDMTNKIGDGGDILHSEILSSTELIKTNISSSRQVWAVKEVTIGLTKICGGHAADGTLTDGYFRLSDGDRNAVESFRRWIDDTFRLQISNAKKAESKNEWILAFHNKVVCRYLNKFFGFPYGIKTYTVGEPHAIELAGLEYRKAFLLGVLTFEAGIGITPGIEGCVASRNLQDAIRKITHAAGIGIVAREKRRGDPYWRFWTGNLTMDEAEAWLGFFEPKTEKWYKLYELIHGYQGKVTSVEEASYILRKVYGRKPSSKVTTDELLALFSTNEEMTRYEIASAIQRNTDATFGGKWAHSVSHHVKILTRCNIITVKKGRFGPKRSFGTIVREVYTFNPDITSWRVPWRPGLNERHNPLGEWE